MWDIIKAPFVWLKDKWTAFSAWIASWFPGWKTQTVAALGAVGSLAATMQEFVSGLPLNEFVTTTQVTMITTGLFILTFWFRRLSNYNT